MAATARPVPPSEGDGAMDILRLAAMASSIAVLSFPTGCAALGDGEAAPAEDATTTAAAAPAAPAPKISCDSNWPSLGKSKPAYAIDGDWRSVWRAKRNKRGVDKNAPCGLTVDLGEEKRIFGFVYMPPPYSAAGRIAEYRVDVGDGSSWTEAAAGLFPSRVSRFWPDAKEKMSKILFDEPVEGRFLKLVALSTLDGKNNVVAAAEFRPILDSNDYPWKDETLARLKGTRMAPSIHLWYKTPRVSKAYYVEIAVKRSTPGSYFMAIGFKGGYFGIQELGNGKKRVLFSVWDVHKGNDPNAVPDDVRVKPLFKGKGVTVRRFGGEGTGGQSFFPYDWKIGERCAFMVEVGRDGPGRAAYTAYFRLNGDNRWKKVATFSRLSKDASLRGFYSFVEDFKRDFKSFDKIREACFLNPWALGADGKWRPLKSARFRRDGNPNLNIDAGPVKGGFFLKSGDGTRNETVKLGGTISTDGFGRPPRVVRE